MNPAVDPLPLDTQAAPAPPLASADDTPSNETALCPLKPAVVTFGAVGVTPFAAVSPFPAGARSNPAARADYPTRLPAAPSARPA